MVGGQVEATAKLGGISLVTEIYQIRDFINVRRPVSRADDSWRGGIGCCFKLF
jgi:hypothetical protein